MEVTIKINITNEIKRTKIVSQPTLEHDFQIFEIINDCLSVELSFSKTTEYFHKTNQFEDFRNLVNGKKDTFKNERYTQVFEEN